MRLRTHLCTAPQPRASILPHYRFALRGPVFHSLHSQAASAHLPAEIIIKGKGDNHEDCENLARGSVPVATACTTPTESAYLPAAIIIEVKAGAMLSIA